MNELKNIFNQSGDLQFTYTFSVFNFWIFTQEHLGDCHQMLVFFDNKSTTSDNPTCKS
jgi:hypothetical protein